MTEHVRNRPIAALKWSLAVVSIDDGHVARLALRARGDVIAFVDLAPSATILLSKALLEYALAAANGSRAQGTTIGKPTVRTLGEQLLATTTDGL
jgi:hypothetical protein